MLVAIGVRIVYFTRKFMFVGTQIFDSLVFRVKPFARKKHVLGVIHFVAFSKLDDTNRIFRKIDFPINHRVPPIARTIVRVFV
jgi:hypothetical protein